MTGFEEENEKSRFCLVNIPQHRESSKVLHACVALHNCWYYAKPWHQICTIRVSVERCFRRTSDVKKGGTDFLKPHGTVLLEAFVDPSVIHHPKDHTVPRLDEKGLEIMLNFLEKIEETLSCGREPASLEEEKEAILE